LITGVFAVEKIVIFGASKQAEMIYFYLTHDSPYEVAAFTVNRDYITQDNLHGLPVVPFEEVEAAYPPDEYKMLVAIFAKNVNKVRAEKYNEAKSKGYELINYISSKAIVWPGLVIGDNCLIFENCICHPFCEIGSGVIMRSGCQIGHHAVVKDYCFFGSGAVVLGSAVIEPYCFIGANATIRDRVTIARECVVGAGALILKDTEEKGVYKGNSPTLLPIKSDELRMI